jgi:post-segregation antitoxin (ccd killing protein)
MGRVTIGDGQEILHGDLNKISVLLERELYDRILRELMNRQVDAFFKGSFLVSRVSGTSISVAAGLGIQYDSSQVSPEPNYRPIYRSAAVPFNITTPHATNPRIDIVCVKAARAATLNVSRKFKSAFDSTISNQNTDVETDWQADVIVTAGTPAPSPTAPATPAGYIKIAEIAVTAVTGIAASGAIADKRTVISHGNGFDITVGSNGDYPTLAAAVAAAAAGARILVLSSEALASTVVLSNANVEIVMKPGVVLSDSGAGTGIRLSASGCRVKGGRFSGFTVQAILIDAGSNYSIIGETRFASTCAASVTDNNGKTSIYGTIDET